MGWRDYDDPNLANGWRERLAEGRAAERRRFEARWLRRAPYVYGALALLALGTLATFGLALWLLWGAAC